MNEKTTNTRKTQIIKSRVTEKKYEEIQKYVDEYGISVSSLVAQAVTEYLKKERSE